MMSLPVPAVGLEVYGRGDAVADEYGEREVAQAAAGFRDIGLEEVVVAEEQAEALALDDQRIEGREDVDACGRHGRLAGRPPARG